MGLTVNDRTYDAGKAEIRFGATAAGVQKISFGDKLNKEIMRRVGSQEIAAITDGEYETEDVSATIEQSVWNKTIFPKLPENGYGNHRFVISIHLFDRALGLVAVRLEQCTISGEKDNIESGPGGLVKELTMKTQQIVRNGKTLNRRSGTRVRALADLIKL